MGVPSIAAGLSSGNRMTMLLEGKVVAIGMAGDLEDGVER
jgi:hypothetical protein